MTKPRLTDEELLKVFLESGYWQQELRKKTASNRWGEIEEPIRAFVRMFYKIPFGAEAPLEVELTTQRIASLYRSSNATKAAQTRKERRERRDAQARRKLLRELKARRLKLINKWNRRRRKDKKKSAFAVADLFD